MSDGQTIFPAGTPAQPTNNGGATPPNDPSSNVYADLLNSIKNERGEPKYKDVQTALDALKHSQEFIPQIKTELEQKNAELERLRAEAARVKELEDTLLKLSSGQQPPQQTQTPAPQGLSTDDVAKIVSQTLDKQAKEKTAKENTQSVVQKMAEAFGADAEKVFYQKAKEFGLTEQQVNDLAAQSPQAVFNLYGIGQTKQQSSFPAPSQGSINPAGYQPQAKSNLGKNDKSVIIGATSEDLRAEREAARALVDELHANNLSTYDLTDPKTYFKYFK